jgi:hypothetical protein
MKVGEEAYWFSHYTATTARFNEDSWCLYKVRLEAVTALRWDIKIIKRYFDSFPKPLNVGEIKLGAWRDNLYELSERKEIVKKIF